MVRKSKLPFGWVRYRDQEGGAVVRWYEKKGVIASVVEGYFPTELNVRISTGRECLPEIRGHKSIMEKLSDVEYINTIERNLRRWKKWGRKESVNMGKKPIGELAEFTCAECGHTWQSKYTWGQLSGGSPKRCPKCKSTKWNG